jgi:hypothetical protein
MTDQPNHPATLIGVAVTLFEAAGNHAAAAYLLSRVRAQDERAVERGRAMAIELPMLRVPVGECGRDKAALVAAVRR